MKTRCPACGFEGDIRDDLIPEDGRTVGCPKCKAAFTVKRTGAGEALEKDGALSRDVEVDGRDFIPYRERSARRERTPADRMVGRIVVFALSFAVVFVVGFFLGRYSHDYTITNPFQKREMALTVMPTPVSPVTTFPETVPPPDQPGTPEKPDMPEKQPGVPDDEVTVVPSSEPLILEDSFTSDEFLDIAEIDGKLNEETLLTGVQREIDLKEYAQGLVGKMLVGYFVVKEAGKLGPSFGKMLPLTLYSYYIQAEAESRDPKKSVVYVGLKQVDDMVGSLDRGAKIYIRGFIYSAALASDYYEFGLANARVEASR